MRSLMLAIVTALALALTPALASAAVVHVETTGSDSATCGPLATPCQTITYALGRTVSGDTVQIGVGTFPTKYNAIGAKSLTIVGAGSDQTLIDGQDATDAAGNGMFRFNKNSTASSISDLSIINPARRPGATTLAYAIIAQPDTADPPGSAALTIDNVVIDASGLRDLPISAAHNAGDITINNVQLENVDGMGIYLEQVTGEIAVTNSSVDNQVADPQKFGIYEWNFGSANFQANGPHTFSNNTLTGGGIGFTGGGRDINNVSVTDSTFSPDNTYAIYLQGDVKDTNITDNIIRGGTSGIHIAASGAAVPTGIVANANQIVDNGDGVSADAGVPINANLDGNWWGCNEGPAIASAPPASDCDAIKTDDASNLTLDNWIVLRVTGSPLSALPWLSSASVTAGFDQLNTGAAAPAIFADGTTLPLSATMGTLGNSTPTLSSGLVNTTFTSNWRTNRSVSATFDHEIATHTWATDPTPMTLHVETPANGGNDSATCGPLPHVPCATLTQAYANSLSGDTIEIGVGTFPQTTCVAITHDLTIEGAGPGNTILDGQSQLGMICDGMLTPSGSGTTISISELGFANLAAGPGSAAFAIFAVPSPQLDSVNVHVTNIEVNGNGAAKSPCAFSSSNNLGRVSVDGLVWPSADGNAIMLQNHAGPALVEDSTITQSAGSVAIFDYSWGGGAKTVTGEHIFRRNTINAANAIYVNAGFSYSPTLGPSSYLDDVIFENNTINSTPSSVYGIRVANTPRSAPSPTYPSSSPATIDRVQLRGNTFNGAGSGSAVSFQGKVDDAQIDDNSIRGYARGVDLAKSPVWADDFPSNAMIQSNQIVDNGAGVRIDVSGHAVAADLNDNWWGCNAGPVVGASPPDGDCDTVETPDASALALSRWIQLHLFASTSTLAINGASQVYAGLTMNNLGGGAPQVFADGTILPLTATGGTLGNASPPLNASSASTSFTSTAGQGRSVSATMDHQTVTWAWPDLDTTPPVITITAPAQNAVIAAATTALTFTTNEPATCTPPSGSTMPLAFGSNTFTVTCTDAAGNVGSAQVTVNRPDALPACARDVMITDVKRVGSRTRIRGIARTEFAGKHVSINYEPSGNKTIGKARISSTGAFQIVVNRPSNPRWTSNRARYRAQLNTTKTAWIKLSRRMNATAVTYDGNGRLELTGSVSLPIAKGQPVRVWRSDACGKWRQIGSVRMKSDGSFSGSVASGGGSAAAVYIRVQARVTKSSNPRYRFNTYSIVQPVVVER